jgi:hypothetical protein
MYRVLTSSFLLTVAFAGHVGAGSITTLPAMEPDAFRSIIYRGEAAAPIVEARSDDGVIAIGAAEDMDAQNERLSIGNSMVAFGADAIPVSHELVSALPDQAPPAPPIVKEPLWLSMAVPTVIRGGDAGGLFARAVENEAYESTADAAPTLDTDPVMP